MSVSVQRNYFKRHIVGVSDMKVSDDTSVILETHSLGSCLGVAAYDPEAHVGALLHFQLPLSKRNQQKAAHNPFMFADTGLVKMLEEMIALGASKKRMVVKVAGGASHSGGEGVMEIGRRNYVVIKKLLWKNGMLIAAEDVSGDSWRNLKLEINSGRAFVKDKQGEFEL